MGGCDLLARRMFSFLPFDAPSARSGRGGDDGGWEQAQLPAAQELFWRERYLSEPYFVAGRGYDQYQPAYALGWHAAQQLDRSILNTPTMASLAFAAQDAQLSVQWNQRVSASFLTWGQARDAARAAWMQALCPKTMPSRKDSDLQPQVLALLLAVYMAGRQTLEAVISYRGAKHNKAMGQTLQRIQLEMQGLLEELKQILPAQALQQHVHSEKKRPASLEMLQDVWRDALFLQDESVSDIQRSLQTWFNSYLAISLDAVSLKLAHQLKRHMLTLRGHITAIQWMDSGAA